MRTREVVGGLCLTAVVLLTPVPSHAFSVTNHTLITEAAVRVIRKCIDEDANKWGHLRTIADYTVPLIACNARQDDPERKVVMWHFYANGKPPRGTFLKGDFLNVATSFDAYYQMIVDGLGDIKSIGKSAAGDVGALVHYLQDLCVPAHVVPIFHPSPVWNGDRFDGFPFQEPTNFGSCESLLGSSGSFAELLKSAGEDTTAAIKQKIPRELVLNQLPVGLETWEDLFWSKKDDASGFGRYRCRHDHFGEEDFRCGTTKVSIAPGAYLKFANDRHSFAVAVTVRALALAHRNHLLPERGPEPIACPVADMDTEGNLEVCHEALTGPASDRCAARNKLTSRLREELIAVGLFGLGLVGILRFGLRPARSKPKS